MMPKRQKLRQAEDRKWEVFMDKLLPESIIVSALQHNLVLVDEGQRRVVLGELTVPWEESIAEAHGQKLLGFEELVAQEKRYICELVAFEGEKPQSQPEKPQGQPEKPQGQPEKPGSQPYALYRVM
ncbi:Hypothetical predicted protein [Octopus vulgaris]|uniref:Uncharacterized protein n=1 Tax=Octopus vulgaris TaxID=6645 RepID=A0AA36BKB4_OCTVU|nr:Hypothetical predicted protein [Octopus vulgaris]